MGGNEPMGSVMDLNFSNRLGNAAQAQGCRAALIFSSVFILNSACFSRVRNLQGKL